MAESEQQQQKTYEFLYETYRWPAPGTQRNCPYSGIPLQLNEKRTGYNGKPWTCPKCIWFFSEEELEDPAAFEGKDCPYSAEQKQDDSGDSG